MSYGIALKSGFFPHLVLDMYAKQEYATSSSFSMADLRFNQYYDKHLEGDRFLFMVDSADQPVCLKGGDLSIVGQFGRMTLNLPMVLAMATHVKAKNFVLPTHQASLTKPNSKNCQEKSRMLLSDLLTGEALAKSGWRPLFPVNAGDRSWNYSADLLDLIRSKCDGVALVGFCAGESLVCRSVALDQILPNFEDTLIYIQTPGRPIDILHLWIHGINSFHSIQYPITLAEKGILLEFTCPPHLRDQEYSETTLDQWISAHDDEAHLLSAPLARVSLRDPSFLLDTTSLLTYPTLTRGYVHHMFESKEILGIQLLTLENLLAYGEFLEFASELSNTDLRNWIMQVTA